MKTSLIAGIVIAWSATLGSSAEAKSACSAHATQPGWHVFVSAKYRFCFEYPPEYKLAPLPTSIGVASESVAQLMTNPRSEVPAANDVNESTIEVLAYAKRFDLKLLTRWAPTGYDDLPKPVNTPHMTFYFYGAGGGGVDYPDTYYFAIRGMTFSIYFFGPYEHANTPAEVTQKIEPKVLASFRQF